jgi:hypothetical protein
MFNLFGKRQEKKSDFEIEDDDDEQGLPLNFKRKN